MGLTQSSPLRGNEIIESLISTLYSESQINKNWNICLFLMRGGQKGNSNEALTLIESAWSLHAVFEAESG